MNYSDRAFIFDMDGTLLDTELVFRDIVFSVATELGFEMTDAIHLAMVGSSHEVTRALLVEAYGVAFPVAIFDEKCRFSMRERMHVAVPIKTGARELLEELRNRGIPTAVATSSRAPHAELHLGAAGLIDFFETIVTRNDVINPKPHPEPYLMAASRLGLAAGHGADGGGHQRPELFLVRSDGPLHHPGPTRGTRRCMRKVWRTRPASAPAAAPCPR